MAPKIESGKPGFPAITNFAPNTISSKSAALIFLSILRIWRLFRVIIAALLITIQRDSSYP